MRDCAILVLLAYGLIAVATNVFITGKMEKCKRKLGKTYTRLDYLVSVCMGLLWIAFWPAYVIVWVNNRAAGGDDA